MGVIEAHAPLIENQYSVVITFSPVGFSLKEDLRVVWIRGAIDTVYLAKNALTVRVSDLFFQKLNSTGHFHRNCFR